MTAHGSVPVALESADQLGRRLLAQAGLQGFDVPA
jgi:hypothetical protein